MAFTLPRLELTIALNCVDKDHPRTNIACVYVHKEGYISALDGKKGYVSRHLPEIENQLTEDFAFFMAKKPTKGIDSVVICPETLQATPMKNGQIQEYLPIQVVADPLRVDYKTYVERHQTAPNAAVSMNPQLMKLMSLFESESINFLAGADNTPSIIRAEEGLMILMPQDYTEIEAPELTKMPLQRAA